MRVVDVGGGVALVAVLGGRVGVGVGELPFLLAVSKEFMPSPLRLVSLSVVLSLAEDQKISLFSVYLSILLA